MQPPRIHPLSPISATALVWVWALGYPVVLAVLLVLYGIV
jgi:hypothetical protein